jgi:short-subunit dehydrogenase
MTARPDAIPPLYGLRALVTGASGGIGSAVARMLAAGGARVALHGRNADALVPLAAELGGTVVLADLSRPGAPEDVVAGAIAALGGLDLVVSAAGAGWAGGFEDMPAAVIDELVAVNLLAPLHLVRAALPYLRRSPRGAVVLVASIAGHLGVAQEAVYSAAKGGLVAFGEALAEEFAPVRVSVISPGPVATSFLERRGSPYGRRHPRPVSAQRVAEGVLACTADGGGELILPRWLRIAAAVRVCAPRLYRRLAIRLS